MSLKIIILFTFTLFIHLPQSLNACSCSTRLTVKEAFESTDVILLGKVLSISLAYHEYYTADFTTDEHGNYTETGDSVLVSEVLNAVEIQVSKKIKNSYVLERITILTAVSDAACGFTFRVGEEYVIYAYAKSPQVNLFDSTSRLPLANWPGRFFTTDICTRTTSYLENELKAIEASNH
ncbi:MAG: hypothetical protein IPN29_03245 [Saprospiraceae bacterium]|nr:hypothetical protein [Saprospiraceae bacterium]